MQPLPSRVDLFRLLGDPGRLRILALAAEEALSVGELAELLGDGQSQISRRAAPLRQAGLLMARKEGTRTFLSAPHHDDDVFAEALREGRRLAEADGALSKLAHVVAAREEQGKQYFDADAAEPVVLDSTAHNLPAHLAALAPVLPQRRLAIDVGTGDGALLDVLAPLYERVIAVDRSPARLAHAHARVKARGFGHVRLFEGSFDDTALIEDVDRQGRADVVYASRTLHHVSRPFAAVKALSRLLAPGGHLIVVDYLPHQNERMRAEHADVWLGLAPDDLTAAMTDAGLEVKSSTMLPASTHPAGPDADLTWQAIVGRRPATR